MHPVEEHYLDLTRRRFFGVTGRTIAAGLGGAALASLLGSARAEAGTGPSGLGAPIGPNFAPKAKRVIYMHMEGAPSQLDLYDYKPGLRARFNQDLPDSVRQGQRL